MTRFVVVAVLLMALAVFLFPKTTTTPNDGPSGLAYTAYKCFGLATHEQISDATVTICYGVLYPTTAQY